ncbi:hypothetical protein AB3S75_035925 [Citrus x aurantiifolia]
MQAIGVGYSWICNLASSSFDNCHVLLKTKVPPLLCDYIRMISTFSEIVETSSPSHYWWTTKALINKWADPFF